MMPGKSMKYEWKVVPMSAQQMIGPKIDYVVKTMGFLNTYLNDEQCMPT